MMLSRVLKITILAGLLGCPFGVFCQAQPTLVKASGQGKGYPVRKYPRRKTGNGILAAGNPKLKEVAITFDDGPHPSITPKILAMLRQYNVRVTFFVVGKMIDKAPELVRRMVDDGHIVGNHSYTHPRLDTMTDEAVIQEIKACSASFYRATGQKMAYVRPPGMRTNEKTLKIFRNMDLCLVDWTDIAGDFIVGDGTKPVDPSVITARAMSKIHNGSILLLHDSNQTLAALPLIIEGLRSRGYRLVTVEEMRVNLYKKG